METNLVKVVVRMVVKGGISKVLSMEMLICSFEDCFRMVHKDS